jgi:hypothetical protein
MCACMSDDDTFLPVSPYLSLSFCLPRQTTAHPFPWSSCFGAKVLCFPGLPRFATFFSSYSLLHLLFHTTKYRLFSPPPKSMRLEAILESRLPITCHHKNGAAQLKKKAPFTFTVRSTKIKIKRAGLGFRPADLSPSAFRVDGERDDMNQRLYPRNNHHRTSKTI